MVNKGVIGVHEPVQLHVCFVVVGMEEQIFVIHTIGAFADVQLHAQTPFVVVFITQGHGLNKVAGEPVLNDLHKAVIGNGDVVMIVHKSGIKFYHADFIENQHSEVCGGEGVKPPAVFESYISIIWTPQSRQPTFTRLVARTELPQQGQPYFLERSSSGEA